MSDTYYAVIVHYKGHEPLVHPRMPARDLRRVESNLMNGKPALYDKLLFSAVGFRSITARKLPEVPK